MIQKTEAYAIKETISTCDYIGGTYKLANNATRPISFPILYNNMKFPS